MNYFEGRMNFSVLYKTSRKLGGVLRISTLYSVVDAGVILKGPSRTHQHNIEVKYLKRYFEGRAWRRLIQQLAFQLEETSPTVVWRMCQKKV